MLPIYYPERPAHDSPPFAVGQAGWSKLNLAGRRPDRRSEVLSASGPRALCLFREWDCRGIDPKRILEKAVEKSLLTAAAAQTMSAKEAMGLIFLPGFTTAEKVTQVSGRGVGLDVVRLP